MQQELVKEQITVEQVGPYGVRVGETWYGLSRIIKPSAFVAGQTYEVGVLNHKNGKKYIQEFCAVTSSKNTSVFIPNTVKKEVKTEKAGDDKVLTIPSIDNKTRQIMYQGLVQAAFQSPALGVFAANYEEYINLVFNAAKRGVDFVRDNTNQG